MIRKVRARAPLRLGLAGGGTDVSPYCDLYGGSVMNITIDMYAYASLELLDEPVVELVAADQGVSRSYPATSQLPIDGTLDLLKGVYNRISRDFNEGKPLPMRITTASDAPPGSGLGSSSTLVVALVQAFAELLMLPMGEYEVAHLAYEIERKDLRLNGGKQDQYAATFGGANFIEFYADDRVIVNPLRLKDWVLSELEASLVLYFTGVSRESARIIDQQSSRIAGANQKSVDAMHRLKVESVATKESLLRGDLARFAESMRAGWNSKKATADSISNATIEEAEEVARLGGAFAGKVSGAGGGGFMFFFIAPEKRPRLVSDLAALSNGRTMNCHFTLEGARAWRVA